MKTIWALIRYSGYKNSYYIVSLYSNAQDARSAIISLKESNIYEVKQFYLET